MPYLNKKKHNLASQSSLVIVTAARSEPLFTRAGSDRSIELHIYSYIQTRKPNLIPKSNKQTAKRTAQGKQFF